MALKDARGVEVSSDNRSSVESFDKAVELFLGYFNDPLAVIDEALEADPAFIMGHCFRAGMMLSSSEKGGEAEMLTNLAAAKALADKANDRERGHIAALEAWTERDFERALALYGRHLAAYPHDICALQFAHLGDFLLGHAWNLRDRPASVLPQWDPSMPGYGYLLGMHAFGLEETGLYRRAEDSGRRAVELNPRDTWAIHAVGHVIEMEGRLGDGIEWYSSRVEDWSKDNGFAFHNWWHLALYHLDLGETDRALEIYDRGVHPADSEVALELVDAAALLWRMHLMGLDVGDRWSSVADSYEAMIDDAYYAFNDFHAMMAFVADGRNEAAGRLIEVVERRAADDAKDTNVMMTREVGLPACQAIRAFGAEDYASAAELLRPLPPKAMRFGGSHAQRDVIHRTTLEAALRAGDGPLARAVAAERTDQKPTSPFNWSMTAKAFDLIGDRASAQRAAEKAESLAQGRRAAAA
ncbi:MAG: tetratricopeptide repeat protein [Kiloniellales bacterium]|nr:tetratricopeptide repeat protein [Kiloniellales bacterium]